MMRINFFTKLGIAVCVFFMVCSTNLFAVIDLDASTVEFPTTEVSLKSHPDASGESLSDAGVVISVRLVDLNNNGVSGFSTADIGLAAWAGPGSCEEAFPLDSRYWQIVMHPDYDTDTGGYTQFSGAMALLGTGSGYSGDFSREFAVVCREGGAGNQWFPITGVWVGGDGNYTSTFLRACSTDISGDGLVSTADVSIFSADINGAYKGRSDLNLDGVVSLPDISVLAAGLGKSCP